MGGCSTQRQTDCSSRCRRHGLGSRVFRAVPSATHTSGSAGAYGREKSLRGAVAQWRWRRTLSPPVLLPPELLGLVALAVFVLVVFGVLPDDDLEEEARRTEAPERRVVAVRVVRTFLPCAAKESAATCASESARSLA